MRTRPELTSIQAVSPAEILGYVVPVASVTPGSMATGATAARVRLGAAKKPINRAKRTSVAREADARRARGMDKSPSAEGNSPPATHERRERREFPMNQR